MPTQQKLNVLVIHNSDFDKQAAEVCFAGRVELTTKEIATFLTWLRDGPASDHVVVSFGDNSHKPNRTTGDRVAFGELDHHVHRKANTTRTGASDACASCEVARSSIRTKHKEKLHVGSN